METTLSAIGVTTLIAAIVAGTFLLGGWALMVFFGVVWSELDVLTPIGYWASFRVGLAVSFVVFAYGLGASAVNSRD